MEEGQLARPRADSKLHAVGNTTVSPTAVSRVLGLVILRVENQKIDTLANSISLRSLADGSWSGRYATEPPVASIRNPAHPPG